MKKLLEASESKLTPDGYNRNFEVSYIFSRYSLFISLNFVASLVFLLIAIVFGVLVYYTTSLSLLHFTSLIE